MSIIGSGEVRLGASAKGLQGDVSRKLQAIRATKDVQLQANAKKFHAEMAVLTRKRYGPIKIGVEVKDNDLKKLDNNLRRVEHTFKRSALSKAIRIQVVVAGAAALPALAQGALSAASALTALGQAALALPGIFSGLLATVGTVLTGMRGLGDAFSAAGKGANQAARNADTYQKASRDLARAQRDMVQAVKDATREIQDQHDKLAQGTLNVEQAQINVRKAQERLAKGGFESITDWQQANLDLKQSYIDLHEATKGAGRDIEDYVSGASKGATQTATWQDAVDKLASATETFADAQKKANGVTDEFLAAMENLSPAGQQFVNTLLNMKGAWTQLQNAVSDKLLSGVADSIVDLANKRLPMLQAGMEKVAGSVNGLFKSALGNLGSDRNARFLSRIFEFTSAAIDKATPGFNSFVNGFIHLSEVGARFLPRLGEAFSDVMGRFERFIDRADADGSLERWIDRGLLVIGKLGDSLGHIGSILESVTTAYETATGNVGGFATTLERGLGKLADYLKSPKGQNDLVSYIKDAQLFLSNIQKALPGIIDAFQSFGDAARSFAEVIFPVFGAIGEWMKEHKVLAETLIKLYLVWVGLLKPITQTATRLWERVGQVREKQARRAAEIRAEEKRGLDEYRAMVKQNTLQLEALEAQRITAAKNLADAEVNAAARIEEAQLRIVEAKKKVAEANWEAANVNAQITGDTNRAQRGVDIAGIEMDRARAAEVMATNSLAAARRQAELMSDVGELQRLRDERGRAQGRVAQLQSSGKLPGIEAELARQRALNVAMEEEGRISQALATFEREREIAINQLAEAQGVHADRVRETDAATRNYSAAEDNRYRVQQDNIKKSNTALASAAAAQDDLKAATTNASNVSTQATTNIKNASDDLAWAQREVATATDDMNTRMQDAAKNGTGKLSSAIGNAKSGLIGGITSLVSFIGPTLAVGGALYALDLWIQYNRDAEEAVQRHKERVDGLADSLSSATGAATESSKQGITERLSNGVNTDTQEKYGDLLKVAEANGIDTTALVNALNTGDTATVNKLLEPVRAKARAGLLGSDSAKTALRGRDNLSEQQLFDAMTGDQGSIDAFGRDSGLRYTLDRLGILETQDLGDVQKGLDPETQKLFQLLQVTGDVQRDFGPAREQQQRENRANYGESQFIPGVANPFGPGAKVNPTDGGRQVVSIPKSFADANPGLLENVIGNGGSVFDTGTGTVELTLMPDRAKNYIQPLSRAGGGPVFGAGSATSDSIPAMLSNGEFVINAKSAQKLGGPFLHALNQGLPGFKTGGPVIKPNIPGIPMPPVVIPAVPAIPPASVLRGMTPAQVLGTRGIVPFSQQGGVGGPTTSVPTSAIARTHGEGMDVPYGNAGASGQPSRLSGYYNALYGQPKFSPIPKSPPKPATTAGAPVVPKKPGAGSPVVPTPKPATHSGSGSAPGPTAHTGAGYAPGPGYTPTPPPLAPSLASGVPSIPGPLAPIIPGQGRTGSEVGLQTNTLRAKRAIEAAFPEIQTIGGVRDDPLHWHPDGLALDVMIPNPFTPEGYALGDRIWEWAKNNPQYGFQFNGESIWRDGGAHENHLHLTTNGGGMPTGAETFNLPGAPGVPLFGGPAGAVPGALPGGLGNPFGGLFGGGSGGGGGGPFDGFLGKIGQIIIQAIGGFFGIDLSGIIGFVNQIAQGFGGIGGQQAGAVNTPAVTGTDYTQSINDLLVQARDARAAGNGPLADQLEKTAQDLRQQTADTTAFINNGGAGGAPVTRQSSPGDIAKYIYREAIARGYSASDARMIVAQAKGESSFNPTISGGQQGDDEVIGIFQEKTAFSGGLSVEDRKDPAKNIAAYFNQLQAHGGPGQEIVDLLARTSVGGPAHPANGGRAYISQLAAQLADPQFLGFSRGGHVRGPGTSISDSIPAYLSKGEFVMRADAVKKYGGGFMTALNNGGVPGFAEGGGWFNGTPHKPVIFTPQQQEMLQPKQYAIDPMAAQIAEGAGSLGAAVATPKGAMGAGGGPPSGWNPEAAGGDARGAFAAATNNQNHLNPALKGAIKGGFSTVGSLASQAASMAVSAGSMGAAGPAAGAAGQLTGAAFEIAGDVAVGAANILSSLAVGTASPTTGAGYGAPLLPQQQTQPGTGNSYVTNNTGDVYTNNLDEYSRLQNRKDAQKSLPFLNRVG